MAADARRNASIGAIVLALTALTSGLALGAVWTLLARVFGGDMPWLALVVAPGMAWAMRSTVSRASWVVALLAAIGTVIAACYREVLGGLGRLASELGLPLLQVLGSTGFDAALDLGRMSMHRSDLAWYGVAALLAFVLTLWPWRSASDPVL